MKYVLLAFGTPIFVSEDVLAVTQRFLILCWTLYGKTGFEINGGDDIGFMQAVNTTGIGDAIEICVMREADWDKTVSELRSLKEYRDDAQTRSR